MTEYALRKSVGPFSAGTRVRILSDNLQDKTYTIELQVPNPKKETGHNYSYEDLVFDIDKTEIVELRNRMDNVPATTRQKRRAFLKTLFGGTSESRV